MTDSSFQAAKTAFTVGAAPRGRPVSDMLIPVVALRKDRHRGLSLQTFRRNLSSLKGFFNYSPRFTSSSMKA